MPKKEQEAEVEAKRAVITSDALAASAGHGRKLKVHGLRGSYRDAKFRDDHVSHEKVSPETEEALREQFKHTKIEVVDEQAEART